MWASAWSSSQVGLGLWGRPVCGWRQRLGRRPPARAVPGSRLGLLAWRAAIPRKACSRPAARGQGHAQRARQPARSGGPTASSAPGSRQSLGLAVGACCVVGP